MPGLRVDYAEVEPLRVALGIDVILHQQIILVIRNLLSHVQVATFKARLKQESPVFGARKLVHIAIKLNRDFTRQPQMGLRSRRLIFVGQELTFFYEVFDIQVILVLECLHQLNRLCLRIKDGRVSRKNNISYFCCIFVNLWQHQLGSNDYWLLVLAWRSSHTEASDLLVGFIRVGVLSLFDQQSCFAIFQLCIH